MTRWGLWWAFPGGKVRHLGRRPGTVEIRDGVKVWHATCHRTAERPVTAALFVPSESLVIGDDDPRPPCRDCVRALSARIAYLEALRSEALADLAAAEP